MVANNPRRANEDRQPRQSNGAAMPPIKPPRPAAPAPPAPGLAPYGAGPRGINVGPRLKNYKCHCQIFLF